MHSTYNTFRSPFPSRFIRHAICFQNKEQLELCRFLFLDAIQFIEKQAEQKFCLQVYRGMKISNEHIEHFEEHIGKLICSSGFFPCTKSRSNAVALATLTTYRPDLTSVLFKIDCEAEDPFIELSNQITSSTVIFDISMIFRVTAIDRQSLLTIIRLKTANKNGEKIARKYLNRYQDRRIESLLDEIPSEEALISEAVRRSSKVVMFYNEDEAKKYIAQNEIDLAILTYQRI